MTARRQPAINVQRPLVAGVIITDGAGGIALTPGARGIASVAFGAAVNQIDITFEESFSDNRYIGVTSGAIQNRLAFFLVNNPPAPGGLQGCEVFASTIDATGAQVPLPDLTATAGFFSIIIAPSS